MKKSIGSLIIVLFISVTVFSQNTPWSTSGFIGIGTTTPSEILEVNVAGGALKVGSSSGGNNYIFSQSSTNKIGLWTANESVLGSSSDLIFRTGLGFDNSSFGVERMRMTSNGNLGIGTTNPIYKFQVQNDVSGSVSRSCFFNDASGTNQTDIVIGNSSTFKLFYMGTNYGGTGLSAFLDNRTSGDFLFKNNGSTAMSIATDGTVGIGTNITPATSGAYKLLVDGKIGAREIKVTATTVWPDYVFAKEYNLISLTALEQFIKQNKHLPNMPSAEEVKKEGGVNLGEMNAKLLEKIEELTLYMIQLKKENEDIKKDNTEIKKSLQKILNNK